MGAPENLDALGIFWFNALPKFMLLTQQAKMEKIMWFVMCCGSSFVAAFIGLVSGHMNAKDFYRFHNVAVAASANRRRWVAYKELVSKVKKLATISVILSVLTVTLTATANFTDFNEVASLLPNVHCCVYYILCLTVS